MDTDNLWFLGSGIAIILSGLLNFVSLSKGGSMPTLITALLANLLLLTLFCYAIPILGNSQVYIGVGIFLITTLCYCIEMIKRKRLTVKQQTTDVTSPDIDTLSVTKTIPMFRFFDKKKATEFYVDWLGFSVDWEHSFSEGKPPIYMQISKSGMVIHLTEHHGDCTPGAKAFIECSGLREYHKRLIESKYAYNAPGLETAPWKSLCMEVVDPFGNKLLFSEAQ
jgi:uncharacterized glyoxalase superfamily protein PhnB